MNKIVLAFLLLGAGSAAHSAILFENPFPASPEGGWCSPCDPNNPDWRAFDKFTLASDSTLTGLEVALHDITPGGFVNHLLVEIFTDNTFTTTLFSQVFNDAQYARVDPLAPANPGNSFPFITFSLPNVGLAAGDYWVSYFGVNGSAAFGAVAPAIVDGSVIQQDLINNQFFNRNDDMAFRFFGEVPEPGTLALLGLALAGLVFVRKRKPMH